MTLHFAPATAANISSHLRRLVSGTIQPEGLGEPLAEIYAAGVLEGRRQVERSEAALNAAYDDFLSGKVRGEDLPFPLAYLFLAGLWQAQDAMRAALEQAQADADRHYSARYSERPAVPPESLADRERIRGYPERAARIDEANRARFGDTAA